MEHYTLCCLSSSIHKERWLLNYPSCPNAVCLACVVATLEDNQQLSLKKQYFLSAMLDILHCVPHLVVEVLDYQAAIHTVKVMMDLSRGNSENLISSAGECLLLLLIHLKNEALVVAIVQKLSVGVQEECNYQASLPCFKLLGKILQLFPEVTPTLSPMESQFFNYIANALTFPSDAVKSAVLYIFLQIYDSKSGVSDSIVRHLHILVLNGTLSILQSVRNKDVLKNASALLKAFISKSPENIALLFETNSSSNVNFLSVVKSILLSNDSALQICIVQCLCQTLFSAPAAEILISILMDANIPEFLFEVLSTSNELLTESALCCFVCFSRYPIFYEKCHSSYGIESLMNVMFRLLKNRNWKLITMNLNLLTSMFSSHEYIPTLAPHDVIFQKWFKLFEELFKISNPSVLLASSSLFTIILKKENLPWPLPISEVYNLVKMCMMMMFKQFCPHSHLSVNKSSKQLISNGKLSSEINIFTCGLKVVEASARLMKEHSLNPVTMETAFSYPSSQNCPTQASTTEIINGDKFVHFLMLSLDEIFIPCYLRITCLESRKVACFYLIRSLCSILEYDLENFILKQLIRKLMKVGFLKQFWDVKTSQILTVEDEEVISVTNKCLKLLIICLLKSQALPDPYVSALEIGIFQLNRPLKESAFVLSQRCDFKDQSETTRNVSATQMTFLCLCYISYLQEELIIDVGTLLPHLICYATCLFDRGCSFLITLKHLIFILAICTYELQKEPSKLQTGLKEVNVVVKDYLSKVSSPNEVYTHHKIVLWWCFHDECENAFSSFALRTWIQSCMRNSQLLPNEATSTLLQLLCTNKFAQLTFASLFDISDLDKTQEMVNFLKLSWMLEKEKANASTFMEDLKRVIKFILEQVHISLINKLMMKNNNAKESNDNILSIGLNFFVWFHHNIENIQSSEMNMKLFFHVSKFCSTTQNKDECILVSCLAFIRLVISSSTDDRSWHMISSNTSTMSFLHKCLTHQVESLKFAALHLLVTAVSYQVENGLKCDAVIKVHFNHVLNWLYSDGEIQSLALHLLRNLTKVDFQNIMLSIIPSENELFHNKLLPLSKTDVQLLVLLLQNIILLVNPLFDNDAVFTFINILSIVSRIDPVLECHIMLQPWSRIMLELRLRSMQENTLLLFEMWLDYKNVNLTIAGVVKKFTELLVELVKQGEIKHERILRKIILSNYKKYISKSMRQQIEEMTKCSTVVPQSHSHQKSDLMTKVEEMVSSCIMEKKL